MKKFQIPLLLLLVGTFIYGCGVKSPKVTTESVDVKLETFWVGASDMASGGIIFGRGEGSSGVFPDRGEGSSGVITVTLPVSTDEPADPVELSVASITHMDITVITETGETKHFDTADITTAAYFIGFQHTWPSGITVTYIVKNVYEGEW